MIPFEVNDTAGQPGGSALLDRILARLRTTLRSLQKAVTNETLVRATIAVTDTQVFHGLDAPPTTWEVVDSDADANVWRSATVNARPRHLIILRASAPVTVLLRFS